jgi:hypothetical protein
MTTLNIYLSKIHAVIYLHHLLEAGVVYFTSRLYPLDRSLVESQRPSGHSYMACN